MRQVSLAEAAAPQAYVCYAQLENPGYLTSGSLVVRSSLDPASLASAVRSRIRSVDREAAVNFQSMDAVVAASLARHRFQSAILGVFAALALLLAAIGLFGVLSYMVSSHRAEIGIRMALGAQPAELFGMVTRRALSLATAGIGIGLAGCLAMRQVMARLLFGIGPSDPPTLIAAAVLLVAVALAASWYPARRAMRLDPMAALREE
jgi:putative ABC transport system permease protein